MSDNDIQNPILPGFHPDPCICRADEDYFIATSTFEWFPGVRIFHSRDLKKWQLIATPLDTQEKLNLRGNPDSGGIWAPALSYADGKFWLLYTDVKVIDAPWKNGRNFLITADNIEGPWSQPVAMGNGGFDPSLFHNDQGDNADHQKYYVYRMWGPRHHSDPNNFIVIQRYDSNTQKLDVKRHIIFKGSEFKYTEAPHLYFHEGCYYLLTAEGGTSFEHRVTVARSQSLMGPYEMSPHGPLMSAWQEPNNPLQKAGHGSLVKTQTGQWYLAYLASRPLKFEGRPRLARWGRGVCPLGRETAIAKIQWGKDGWPFVSGGPTPQLKLPAPCFPETPEAKAPKIKPETSANPSHIIFADEPRFIDTFNSEKLSGRWQTLRIPFGNKMGSLSANPDALRLYGNDSLVSLFEQSTVATRWRHHAFTAVTQLAFNPKNFQQSAGLCCYYNTQNFTYCYLDFDEELQARCLRIVQVDKQSASFHYYDAPIVIDDIYAFIWLKVEVDGLKYCYSYSLDGHHFIELPAEFESWKISDDYIDGRGFFTGAFVGLHCEDISGDGCYADFYSFSYAAK